MSEAQAQQALQRLYEDSSIRDELTDEESEVLLQWGEAQIKRLAAQELDAAAFEEAYTHLARLLTRMGALAAGQPYMPPEEAQAALARVDESAQAVGLHPAEERFGAQAASDDIMGNLQALIVHVDAPVFTASASVPDEGEAAAPAEPSPEPPTEGESPSGLSQLFSGLARFLSSHPPNTEGNAAHGEEEPEQQ